MSEQASWVPDGVDEEVVSAARLYDYLLGGAHNFAADRALAEKFLEALPSARNVARLNRAFLRRAVLLLTGVGIRQFLDIGSGIPTVGNVHEIAQGADPSARVVYVDNEPVAVAHSELLLEGNEHATVLAGDMRCPETILEHAKTRQMLDFSQPIGLLMAGVFHFIPHELDAPAIIQRFTDALVPGSYLALSHFTSDVQPEEMAGVVNVMRHSANPIYPRAHAEVTELFTGFELVEPGVVGTAQWRPDSPEADAAAQPGASQIYAGVGRKL